jgi:hypothetical protein
MEQVALVPNQRPIQQLAPAGLHPVPLENGVRALTCRFRQERAWAFHSTRSAHPYSHSPARRTTLVVHRDRTSSHAQKNRTSHPRSPAWCAHCSCTEQGAAGALMVSEPCAARILGFGRWPAGSGRTEPGHFTGTRLAPCAARKLGSDR